MAFKGRVRFLKRRGVRALLAGVRSRRSAAIGGTARDAVSREGLEHLDDARWRLMETDTRFRELLDGQQAFIVRRDADYRITFANKAFCEAFDIRPDEVSGQCFWPETLATEDWALFGKGRDGEITLHATRDGPRWVQWRVHTPFSSSGVREIHAVGRDVTDERHVALALKDARNQAEAGNRAKSRFLAAMSHEIRTPMNGILGMANLLGETELTSEQLSYQRAIDQSARTLLSIINEILDFSKIEAGKLRLVDAPFSLRAVIERTIELLSLKAAERNNRIQLTVEDDVPEFVLGDESRVGQIIMNLLSNAVKFTYGGNISVSVCRSADGDVAGYAIAVADTGIGFSEDMMQRLFVEFEQAGDGGGERHGGTGLGLAIAKRLANAMGGDIDARGAPGEGATFTARLKLGEVADADWASRLLEAERGASAAPVSCVGARVLIVEDNAINALLALRVCERAGAIITLAKNGHEALAVIEETLEEGGTRFDLVLMDVFMPVMDGLEACARVKELFRSRGEQAPAIIALTAHAFAEDRVRCLKAGMDDYLAKPFDLRQLEAVIGKWVTAGDDRPAKPASGAK